MQIWSEIVMRVRPSAAPHFDQTSWLIMLAVTLAIIAIKPIWRLARLPVTFAHELGHAVIGIVCGRKFTAFVLRADASGHAITRGPNRGVGRVLTTWAGYPAPAIVGAALTFAVLHGWAAPVLAALVVIAAIALTRVRSLVTGAVTLALLAALAALWWLGPDDWQARVLLVVGAALVVGAWRHLGAVIARPSRGSDPAVLAALTRVPALVWNATFAAVCAGATWIVMTQAWAVWPR